MIIHWNADPVLLSFGFIHIRWYSLLFAAGFMAGLYMMHRIYAKEGVDPAELEDLFLYLFAGTLLGARLGHCLFYDPVFYRTHPLAILKIWEGGLASHGGAIGVLTALTLFCVRHGRPLIWLLDRLTIPAAFAGALIRIGNFMNSEILGVATRGDFGIVFHRVDLLPRHPVQLYEALAYLLIFGLLLLVYRRRGPRCPDKRLTGIFLITVFTARFFLEYLKLPQAAFSVFWSLRMGQILSIPFIFAGIIVLIPKRSS